MSKEHAYPVLIREQHLDTFGHVNNAVYLQLFEEARWEWMTERGYGLDKIQETRCGPVILEVQIKFRRELKNRDRITIYSHIASYEGKVGVIRQKMKREDGSLACDASLTCALWDLDERKIIEPTEEWLIALDLKEN